MGAGVSAGISLGVGAGVGASIMFGIHSCVGPAVGWGIGSGQLVWYKMEHLGCVVGHVKHHVFGMESRSRPVSCLWMLLRLQMCAGPSGYIRVCERKREHVTYERVVC